MSRGEEDYVTELATGTKSEKASSHLLRSADMTKHHRPRDLREVMGKAGEHDGRGVVGVPRHQGQRWEIANLAARHSPLKDSGCKGRGVDPYTNRC